MSWGSPLVYQQPPRPLCQVLRNPHTEAVCGRPSDGIHTVLEKPICNDCWQAMKL